MEWIMEKMSISQISKTGNILAYIKNEKKKKDIALNVLNMHDYEIWNSKI